MAEQSGLSDIAWSEIAERACRERDTALGQVERLRAALEGAKYTLEIAQDREARLRVLVADFVETLTIGRVSDGDYYDLRARALAQARGILEALAAAPAPQGRE